MPSSQSNRRKFIKESACLAASWSLLPLGELSAEPHFDNRSIYLIGPQEGFSPRVGTLLSTMTMMRTWVVRQVEKLSVEELDFLIDDNANSIGAMLLHLAATEKYYQLNTFQDMEWGTWSDEIKANWDVPMGLGDAARKEIRGNTIDYYLNKLEEVRAETISEFAKRDDAWLAKSENFFGGQPTNNHCKWFHVCEHESNHNGQIKFIMKRLPA